jgi:replicative DNA helicase
LDEYLEGGLRPAELVIIGARPSMGKAQPLDAKVLTDDGWSLMGDLKIGDSLVSIDGAPSVVTGIFPQGEKQVFLVTFTDGRTAECCDEHLWRVYHRKWLEPKILSTKEIKRLMQNPTIHRRMWIETLTGDFGDKSSMPVNPWLLGALLGDGNFTNGTIRFSNTSDQMLGMVRESLPNGVHLVYAGGCDWRITRTSSTEKNPLTNAMLSLGLMGARSETKFVPEIYMKADKNTRLSVLRGLMDTDGWVEKCGAVLFSSSSQQLAKDVQELARSLGYWCSIKEKNTGYKKNGEYHPCQTAYVLSISGDETHDLFLFDKKKSRCINKSRPKRVVFLKIEESRKSLCQCISVSHKSHLYITDNYVVTHNTAIAMTIGLEMANEFSIGFLSMEMSHNEVRDRMTAMLGNVSLSSVKRPNKGQGLQWDRVVEGTNKAQKLNFYVSDQGGLNINQVRSKARNLKRMKGLNVLIIDYIGLMAGLDQKQNRNTQLEEVSRGLKNLAKELDISIVCLAQLNRKSEERPEQMPMMSDLRDCGAIEQDADVIVFIKRPIMANPELGGAWQDYAKLSIAKNRQGRCGYLNLSYTGEQTRFSEWHGEAPRKEAVQQKRGMN